MEYRIIDVNINRLNEAIRVIEDIVRLKLNNKKFSKNLKKMRHSIQKFSKKYYLTMLKNRDIKNDKSKFLNFKSEFKRVSILEILVANFKRMEESCRVLEEILKVENSEFSKIFKEMRFYAYTLEKNIILEFMNKTGVSATNTAF